MLGLLAAAPVRAGCIVDAQGADDEPGQKDVSELCEPGATCSSGTLSLRWQLDDLSWSGSNTGDACALFDINDDGLADRAICVTVFGAAKMAGKCSNNQFLGCIKDQDCGKGGTCIFPSNNTGAPRCYTCANDRPTRCTSSQPVACTSLCGVSVGTGLDPFVNTASHTANKCSGSNCVADDAVVNCCLTTTDVGAGGELIDVCSYPSQQPNSDPSDCVIAPPNCSSNADCDDHNLCTVDTCATGTGGVKFCDNAPGNAGTICRASTGTCDVAETCTGTSRDCPSDALASAATVCRGSAGPCDAVENCTGSSASCPADSFQSTATVCRASAGPCDMAESCTGSSASCPADGFKSSATVCRASAGACDVAESCTGSSADCPADGFQSATVCRASAGACDVAESCTGSSANCPADGFTSSNEVCRASAGPCDVAETCTGSSANCPADAVKVAGEVCRPSAGDCDVAENCSGDSAACPPDQFKSTDVVCRPSAGVCDVAESCPGDGPNCPPDSFLGSDQVCRQVFCPGDGAACP